MSQDNWSDNQSTHLFLRKYTQLLAIHMVGMSTSTVWNVPNYTHRHTTYTPQMHACMHTRTRVHCTQVAMDCICELEEGITDTYVNYRWVYKSPTLTMSTPLLSVFCIYIIYIYIYMPYVMPYIFSFTMAATI